MSAPLPVANAVTTLVGMLVGSRPKVTKGPACQKAHSVATYVDASKTIVYAALADAGFLASSGAALALIPAGVVAECMKTGKPTEAMLENAYEVLNVGASLFNEIDETTLHVKLEQLTPFAQVAPGLAAKLAKPAARLDLLVTIPGYPEGKLSLIALD